MQEKKIDRRVKKTKKILLSSLIELMNKKKINKITVKELTELADINRSTFYLYYDDIFDMVDKIESEIIDNFSIAFREFSIKEATHETTVSFFTYVFEFVKNNSSMCKILLGPDGEYSFIEKFKNAIKDSQPNINAKNQNLKHQFLMPFIVSGTIGTIQKWLEDDMKSSTKDMAEFIASMIVAVNKKTPKL